MLCVRFVIAFLGDFRPESDTHLSIIWSGNTWNYRSALDKAGVKGAKVDVDGKDGASTNSGQYYRILKSIDVSQDEGKVQNIIKDVFHNLAMKVLVESDPIEDSHVAEFIEELRTLPNLHFVH